MPELSLGRAVARLAEQDPDAVCLRVGDRAVTRRWLDAASDRTARRWVRDGLGVDDVVAVTLPPSVDFVLACVAAWKAGATPMPLRLEGAELDDVLSLARPALVVDRPLGLGLGLGDEYGDEDGEPLPDRAASAWKISPSSGSTGRPKLIRAGAPARIDPDAPVAAFVPRRAVQLVAAPIAHAASFVYAMRGLMTGHELVVMAPSSSGRFDAGEWLRLVAAYGVTWAPLNPALMRAIWRHPRREATDISSLESVLHVGARCPDDLKRAWLDWLGTERVVEVYAGSESQGVACIGGREWLHRPGSVGRAVGGTEFRIRRPDGSWCASGELGEIVMSRPGSAYSYLGAEATLRTVDGRDWHTLGDAGHLDADGYLYVGDRMADLVETRAGLVQPADVEAVLDAHPGVRSSAVVARDGRLHAVVEGEVEVADLQAWAADRLAEPLRPASWQVTDEPVRDAAGKVRRSRWSQRPG